MDKLLYLYRNQVVRYCAVGGLNTFITAAVIFFLTALDVGLYISNFCGYFAGVFFSFVLNSYFTFSKKPSLSILMKFIICCAACYVINLIAMNVVMLLGVNNKYYIQFIGMVLYTLSGLLINKFWVMK